MNPENLTKIREAVYEIPKKYKPGMRVPARIYATEKILREMDDAAINQICNVTHLPGIVNHAVLLPDGHSGYGFPIGGTAAIDPGHGVISPGGIGFDINCGVRLVATSLTLEDVQPRLKEIVDMFFALIPSGVGGGGIVKLSGNKLDEAMIKGAKWAVENGYGERSDLEYIEENGCISRADPSCVSEKARDRGKGQLGSLGSGNHFLEIQIVKKENIFDEKSARDFSIFLDNQIVIMIHTGSRGFGHQVASDYLQRFLTVQGKYKLSMPDRELACAPFDSHDGQDYFGAMNCAINIAFLNRQLIMHRVKEIFSDVFKKGPDKLGIRLVYDVCHNTAKLERHKVKGRERELLIHRKGATRAFSKGMKDIPLAYKSTGQPVIIGGSMETGSSLLVGIPEAEEAFFTTAHGSGRMLSRSQAKKKYNGRQLQQDLQERGIYIQTSSLRGLAEEAGGAYKNIDEVSEAAELAGLSRVVARMIPLGNLKG